MDLRFTQDEIAFREEVRAFFADNLPGDIRDKLVDGEHLAKDDMVRWTRILNEKGWAVPHWPVEHGGTGWDPMRQYIFLEELQKTPAPSPLPFGVNMVGPVIYTFGNDEQKKRFLPRIANLDDWWCQGFSEPGAGSDLASLSTRAVREGDHYIVNGQKTWTTLAQYADWIFCLVRTNPDVKKQEGISFLLIDMKSPGITVRPIILLDGEHEVNEVFFDNVKVPVENLVGEENKGWTYAKFLLGHERSGIAAIGRGKALLRKLKRVASEELKDGRPLIEDPLFRARIAQIEIDLQALEITDRRVISAVQQGTSPGPEASMLKIKGTEIRQEIYSMIREASGAYAQAFQPEALEEQDSDYVGPEHALAAASAYFNNRKLTIFGGSNEIQKNIIAKMMLGL